MKNPEVMAWINVYELQGKKCASCDKPLKLKETFKNKESFKLVCFKCFSIVKGVGK